MPIRLGRRVLAALLIAMLAPAGVTVARAGDARILAQLARSIMGADQGVYVESADGTVLVAQAAARAVHPASVSKVPTTLALLRKFGPQHRFITTFTAQGRIHDGTLDGDLVVESDGDPYFVDENALLVLERLQQLGIRRVGGNLCPKGALTFDWQSDADAARLRRALSGIAPPAAWAAVRALDAAHATASTAAALEPIGIEFAGGSAPGAARLSGSGSADPPLERLLLVHRSQPLLSLVKELNDYSNNIFKPLADAAGGAAAVETLARAAVPASMRAEIVLGDGAGTDPRNRLSPRAAVTLLRALERELEGTGHALFDILPVAGVDEGTLQDRLNGPAEAGRVVGKTGTFGDYGASALIGAIATRDQGTVYFAILDHDLRVGEARRRQDRLVRALLAHLQSVPWKYQPDASAAVARAEISTAP